MRYPQIFLFSGNAHFEVFSSFLENNSSVLCLLKQNKQFQGSHIEIVVIRLCLADYLSN